MFLDADRFTHSLPRSCTHPAQAHVLTFRAKPNQVIVLISESTKNLYRFVRWEIETALDLDLPIIAVNLNNKRQMDFDLCPPLLIDNPVVHVAFRARISKYAFDSFFSEYRRRPSNWEGIMFYYGETNRSLGITDRNESSNHWTSLVCGPGTRSWPKCPYEANDCFKSKTGE